jgi:hypothetical protein
MFIAALFTIAKLWKQPRCPTTDEWIKSMQYEISFFWDSACSLPKEIARRWLAKQIIAISTAVDLSYRLDLKGTPKNHILKV